MKQLMLATAEVIGGRRDLTTYVRGEEMRYYQYQHTHTVLKLIGGFQSPTADRDAAAES